MTEQELFTIVMPVYGRSHLLSEALNSVLHQDNASWQLLIADDGSDQLTQNLIEQWITTHNNGRIRWIRRPRNLGLFPNLNRAIVEMNQEWALLLCSDDRLHPGAISTLQKRRRCWPEAGLILSSFDSINYDGSPRPKDSAWHHDRVSRKTTVIAPQQLVPALLQLGSLNGNLTGMAFSRTLWQAAGPFREEWRHAADWDWLVRAAEQGPVVLNREQIAAVRTHDEQLSNNNRRSGHELLEVAEVVRQLRLHPLLTQEPRRKRWAAHVMQFQLWNVLKAALQGQQQEIGRLLLAIHHSAGLLQTAIAMIRWLPQRCRRHQKPSAL